MAFWRKRSEGFEWHEYVRTTILLRRKDRRQKVEEVRAAAVNQVKEGGRQGRDAMMSGLGVAGATLMTVLSGLGAQLLAALRWIVGLLEAWATAAVAQTSAACQWAVERWAPGLSRVAGSIRQFLSPLARVLARPNWSRALLVGGLLLTALAGVRFARFGLDPDAMIAGAAALLALSLFLLGRLADRDDQPLPAAEPSDFLARAHEAARELPGLGRMTSVPAVLVLGALGVSIVSGSLLLREGEETGAAATAAAPASSASGKSVPAADVAEAVWTPVAPASTVEGRAVAVSGATLSIGTRTLRLAGIEAPEPHQLCARPGNKRWRCGEAARDALSRAVRGRRVVCELNGRTSQETPEATCRSGETDIAGELVRQGHVFAETGLFSSYGALESEAEQARAGLWAGEAERPQEWRDRRWSEAMREAPGGCPIKGKVSSGGRRYLLPWSPAYSDASVREQRGERWFCTEDEARAAGWTPALADRR